MFKILCKVWTFIVKIFKMVVDAILVAVGEVVKALLDLGGEIWKSLFGKSGSGLGAILGLGLLGLAAWYIWGVYSDKKEKTEERANALKIAKINAGVITHA